MPKTNRREIRLNEAIHRDFSLGNPTVDTAKRTATLSFASEEPVERLYRGEIVREVIDMGSFDLSRLERGGALLLNHDPDQQVGGITRTWRDGKKARATVKFSRSAAGTDAMHDVADEIRGATSVGYELLGEVSSERDDDGGTTVRFAARALEVSLVGVPADATVGVGRSQEIHTMSPKFDENPASTGGIEKERERVRSIQATAEHFKSTPGVSDLVSRAIGDGTSESELNRQVLEIISSRQTTLDTRQFYGDHTRNTGTYSGRDLENYSFARAILGAADGKLEGLEKEMSDEYGRQNRTSTNGVYIPGEVLAYSKRAMSAAGSGVGDELVENTIHGDQFIELLRARTLAISLGARMLTGLQGDCLIPRMDTGTTATWAATENATIAYSDPALTQVTLSPERLSSSTQLSRLLLIQNSVETETLIREDMAMNFAVSLDAAIFEGAANGPSGITDDATGIVSTASDGSPTYAECLSFEQDISDANVDYEGARLAWVVTGAVRANMRNTQLDSGSGRFLWSDENKVIGYDAFVSNNLASNRVIFGNFREVLVGMWNGIEVIADPFTDARRALVNLTSHMWTDVALRHTAAFSIGA